MGKVIHVDFKHRRRKCLTCGGDGEVLHLPARVPGRRRKDADYERVVVCPKCGGTGIAPTETG